MIPIRFMTEAKLFTARGHKQVQREILRNSMEYQRQTYLPLHFETVAYTRYPGVIRKRSKKYNDWKLRKFGHNRPNVLTGSFRDSVMNHSIVRATSNQATFTAKGTFPLTPERRREIEFISDREITAITTRGGKLYVALAKDPQYQELRRQRNR